MFSMTKSRELDEVQTSCYLVNRRYCGEDVTFYLFSVCDLFQSVTIHPCLWFQ